MKTFFELMLITKKVVISKVKEYKEYFTPKNGEEAEMAGCLIAAAVTVFVIAFGFDIISYFF
jgi:hypothetical protein